MINLYDKKVKKPIRSHYLLTKIQLHNLILLKFLICKFKICKFRFKRFFWTYSSQHIWTNEQLFWIDEQLVEELHKRVISKFKERKVYATCQDTFRQQIYLRWNHCPLRIKMLNIYYVWQIFSLNMHGLNI